MNWGGWKEFFAMGGYALYVWGAYLATFAALCAEVIVLRKRRRNARDTVTRYHSRDSREFHETAP
jgi:heme exporter protein D